MEIMYKIVALSAIAIGLAFPVQAQSLRSDSASSSNSLAAADAAALAVSRSQGGGGGNVVFNNAGESTSNINSNGRIHNTYGTQTIRSAPQVVAPSMSSGHPCAWAPLSVAVSVVGFGGAIGGQRIDDACLLAQMGERPASVSMIAARNPAACRALEAVGRIRAGSCGGGYYGKQAVQYAVPAPRPARRAVATSTVAAGYEGSPKRVSYASLKSGDLYQKNGVVYRKR
jgi:hypothetical protein